MTLGSAPQQIASVRADMTAAIMAATGLDEDVLRDLVHGFYAKVRHDPLLGPVFAARITDWPPHLERVVAFWSSVALMTGRYHGHPVQAHAPLSIDGTHFERWLALFRATASETCTPAGAAHVILRTERIARSLHAAVIEAQGAAAATPALP